MKNSLLVVFELDPRTAVRNDLRQIFVAVALEEHAGRAVKLRNDDALGSVDDERSVVGHQRDLAEENVFFLDVADRRNVRSPASLSKTVRRIFTLSGTLYDIPRS